MSINYALYPNHLTDNPNDHRAMVRHDKSLSKEDIIDIMISRGSTITKADALATLENYEAAIEHALSQGYRINTPLMNISLSISGIFRNHEDYFNPGRHQLHINCNCGLRLKNLPKKLRLKKVNGYIPRPRISRLMDVDSETKNELLTPGKIAIVRGYRLQTDPEDEQQGVFFVGPGRTEIRVNKLIRNMPKELIFTIPDNLTANSYSLEIRAIMHSSSEIRVGRLDAKLQLA
jgi:hypothetical protein